MSRGIYALALLAAAATLTIAGCGSGGNGGAYGGKNSNGETKASSGGGAPAGGGAVVSVGMVPGLGRVLVDSKGLTLYDFHRDEGTASACHGGCARAWPPLLTNGEPRPGNGASAGMLGTTERKGGAVQVTYAGHPLYTYAADSAPGESNGNDIDSFGGEWYALEPDGREPEG